jgi:hypothetical protein
MWRIGHSLTPPTICRRCGLRLTADGARAQPSATDRGAEYCPVCSAGDPFLNPEMLEQALADERVVGDELAGVCHVDCAEGDQST